MNENKELEKYSKYLFFKAAQIIVQSRQGTKLCTDSQPYPKNQSWFCLAINDNQEITHEAKRTISYLHLAGNSIWSRPLCIEISLKTTEGEGLALETWVLSLKEGADASVRLTNTVYNRMGLLLKSLLCVSRALPAYKLSRRQGPETFVMCYRIFSEESNTNHLGNGFQTCHVGQVVTQAGTICLRVDYRTQMTISPPTSSVGMEPYCIQPILVKSDHFSDLFESSSNPDKKYSSAKNQPGSGQAPNLNNNSESSEQAMTSDESQEAMRLFAASPPEGAQAGGSQFQSPRSNRQRRLYSADHHSSNESLGRRVQMRPRSGTNQSGASDDTDSENLKFGAFASKRDILSRKMNTGLCGQEGQTNEDDSPLLELFTVDVSDTESTKGSSAKPPEQSLDVKLDQMHIAETEKSGAIRKISFEDSPSEGPRASGGKTDDFVFLDFKTPFSTVARPSAASGDLCQTSVTATTSDLGIFFKEVSTVSCLKTSFVSPLVTNKSDETCYSIEEQLKHLNDDITNYEQNLNDYDNMLKNLDTNSESEFE